MSDPTPVERIAELERERSPENCIAGCVTYQDKVGECNALRDKLARLRETAQAALRETEMAECYGVGLDALRAALEETERE